MRAGSDIYLYLPLAFLVWRPTFGASEPRLSWEGASVLLIATCAGLAVGLLLEADGRWQDTGGAVGVTSDKRGAQAS